MGVDFKRFLIIAPFLLIRMYSITSMAQTLMARLPRLFQTRS